MDTMSTNINYTYSRLLVQFGKLDGAFFLSNNSNNNKDDDSIVKYPDGPFHNLCATKSVDQQTLRSGETSIDGSWGNKIVKGSVGMLDFTISSVKANDQNDREKSKLYD